METKQPWKSKGKSEEAKMKWEAGGKSKGRREVKRQRAKGRGEKMEMKRPVDLGERLLEYGARVIKVVEALPKNVVGNRIWDQLLRSGTSGGGRIMRRRRPLSRKRAQTSNCSRRY